MGRSGENHFLNSASETLRVFWDNVDTFEVPKIHKEDVAHLAQSLAGLVLSLVNEGIESTSHACPELIERILGLLGTCALKLFDLLEFECCCVVQKQLLAST
jgi:hypothetical protein